LNSPDLAGLANVRALLDRFGSFEFDLVQYLQSLKYADYLSSRAKLYQRYQDGVIPGPLTKDALLRELRRSLVGTVPAYHHYGSVSRFDDLPLISKRDLQVDGHPLVRRGAGGEAAGDNLWQAMTFGTTTAPVSVFYSPAFYFEYLTLTLWKLAYRFRDGAHNGARNGARDGARDSGVPGNAAAVFALCIDDNVERPEFVTLDPSGVTGVTIRVFVDPMRGESLARAFSLIRETRPAVVATRPSLYEALMAYARMEKVSLDAGTRCVFSAGSFLTDETRKEVGRVFGAPVLGCYGLAEFGYSAGECEHLCGYHIDETSVLIELLDPEGRPAPDGAEGEVVLSGTVNDAMPLIRFRTGDYSVIDRDQCRCGFRGPRLRYIKGHGPFHFRFSDGTLLHPGRLYPVAWLFPVRDFQVVEEAPGALHVRIDPDPAAPRDLADRIAAYVRETAPSARDVRVSISKVQVEGRFERFKSAVPGSLIGRD
jgi:hypothetical protein